MPEACREAAEVVLLAASIGYAIVDREARIAELNPEFAEVLGLAVDDVKGRPLADIDPRLAAVAMDVWATGNARNAERWGERLVRCFLIADEEVGILFEPDPEIAETLFEDRLLAVLAHELRAPLSTLLLWTRALRDNADDPSLRARALAAIEQSAQTQVRLVAELVDLADTRRGTLELEVADGLAVADELAAAIARARPAADARAIELEARIDAELGTCTADPARFRQVLDQLLAYTISVSASGDRVIATGHRDDDRLSVSVSEMGKGDREGPATFEPFQRTEGGAIRDGLGAGLTIARAIVEAHGGTLEAGVGSGHRFVMQLPLRRPGPPPKAPGLDGLRVLLVDDDRDLLDALAILLRAVGAVVVTASSAADAWDALELQVPDALVTDLELGDGDGVAFVERVHAHPPTKSVPAVALTAHAASGARERAIAAGFAAYITKPIDIDDLSAVLAALRPVTRLEA